MKLWKWFVRCPMLFLLLFGWFGLTAFTWSEGKMPQKLDQQLIENPIFTALLEPEVPDTVLDDLDHSLYEDDSEREETVMAQVSGDSDVSKEVKYSSHGKEEDAQSVKINADTNDSASANQKTDKQNIKDSENGETISDNGKSDKMEQEEIGVTNFKEYKKVKTNSRYYSDPGKTALTTEFAYEKVDKSYFDDAVFIGDSRTVGMQDYSGLDNAQFFAKTGMNVYDILEDKFITDPKTGDEVSVAHMLKNYKYGKIYFMVGINELGTGNTGTFQKEYERVLRKFHKWQPDAVIYIQGIIPVSKVKASDDEIFNNININDKNVAIAQLADGKDIFYLDVSKKLTDKGGYLKADYTFDEVHMYAQYYELWTNFLMKHAVVR